MPMALNDVVRAVYWQRLFGQRLYTVHHLRVKTVAGVATTIAQELFELAARLGDPTNARITKWQILTGTTWALDEVRVQRVFPQRTVYQKSPIGVLGLNTAPTETANLAISIERRSTRPGRRGVGRMQIAGAGQDKMADGEFDPAYLVDAQDFAEEYLTPVTVPLTGGVYEWVLYGGAPVTDDDVIFDMQAKTAVRTMHRRTLRLGE